MTKQGVSSGGGNKLLPSILFIRDKDSGAWDETGKGFDVMRKVLIPHKLLSCQSLAAGIYDNRKKTPCGVLSHIFCSLQWLAFRVESWEVILTWLHGWSQQECPSNLSLLSGVLECLGGCDGSISPGRRRRGELMSLAKAPRWEHTVLHGLKLLKTSGELSVQCHIYRLDCLWIFHRAATEMLLSDL